MEKSMNNYESHAWREFKAAGWLDENGKFKDEMQEAICNHVIRLLGVLTTRPEHADCLLR